MSRVNLIIAQLDLLNEKANRTTKRKISEQDYRKIYDELCIVYPKSPPDERVDLQIVFEDREPLIEALLDYITRLVQQVTRLTHKDKHQDAITVLRQALVADAIVDGRTDMEVLQKLQNELLSAAQELHFDVESFLQMLELAAGTYVERAYHFAKQENNILAMRCLGRALQLDHHLRDNPKIGDFATSLTGKAPYSAVMMLEDPFLRNSHIRDVEQKRRFQQAVTQEAGVVKSGSQSNLLQRVLNGVFPGKRS